MSDDSPTAPDLDRIIRALHGSGVEYVLIGGQAAALYGSAMPTQDVDIMPRDAADNMERLASALNSLGGHSDIALSANVDELWGMNTRWDTDAGRIDVVVTAVGPDATTVNWHAVTAGAETVSSDGINVRVVALEDLVVMKLATGRPRDRLVAEELLPGSSRGVPRTERDARSTAHEQHPGYER